MNTTDNNLDSSPVLVTFTHFFQNLGYSIQNPQQLLTHPYNILTFLRSISGSQIMQKQILSKLTPHSSVVVESVGGGQERCGSEAKECLVGKREIRQESEGKNFINYDKEQKNIVKREGEAKSTKNLELSIEKLKLSENMKKGEYVENTRDQIIQLIQKQLTARRLQFSLMKKTEDEMDFTESVNCSNPQNQAKNHQIYQIEAILKDSFIICTRAQNSSYFIERVLELEEKEQLLLAEILQQADSCKNAQENDKDFNSQKNVYNILPSPRYTKKTSSGNPQNYLNTSPFTRNGLISKNSPQLQEQFKTELLDRLEQQEQQNQKLLVSLKAAYQENHELHFQLQLKQEQIQELRKNNCYLVEEIQNNVREFNRATSNFAFLQGENGIQTQRLIKQGVGKNSYQYSSSPEYMKSGSRKGEDLMKNIQIFQGGESRNEVVKNQKYYEQVIREYKETVDLITCDKNNTIDKLSKEIQRIQQLYEGERKLKIQKTEEMEGNKKLMEEYREQLEQMMKRCQDYEENVIKKYKKEVEELTNSLQVLEENEGVYKFEINYKNIQIQELKEALMGSNIHDNHNGSENDNASMEDCQRKSYGEGKGYMLMDEQLDMDMLGESNRLGLRSSSSSNILRKDIITSSSYCLGKEMNGYGRDSNNTPRSMVSHLDIEEVKELRVQVKQLTKQVQKLKSFKAKNKELEYERKKLLKILKQYELSRGQENDILAGCLYELHQKIKRQKQMKPRLQLQVPSNRLQMGFQNSLTSRKSSQSGDCSYSYNLHEENSIEKSELKAQRNRQEGEETKYQIKQEQQEENLNNKTVRIIQKGRQMREDSPFQTPPASNISPYNNHLPRQNNKIVETIYSLVGATGNFGKTN